MSSGSPNGDIDSLLGHVAVDFHNHASVATTQGRDGFGALLRATAVAFSPQFFVVHHLVGEGDVVAINLTWHATHADEFLGHPATGNAFSSAQAHFFAFRGPLLSEHWGHRDDLARAPE